MLMILTSDNIYTLHLVNKDSRYVIRTFDKVCVLYFVNTVNKDVNGIYFR